MCAAPLEKTSLPSWASSFRCELSLPSSTLTFLVLEVAHLNLNKQIFNTPTHLPATPQLSGCASKTSIPRAASDRPTNFRPSAGYSRRRLLDSIKKIGVIPMEQHHPPAVLWPTTLSLLQPTTQVPLLHPGRPDARGIVILRGSSERCKAY